MSRACPYCAESIREAAIVCRWCGNCLPPPEPAGRPASPAERPSAASGRASGERASAPPAVTGAFPAMVAAALTVLATVAVFYVHFSVPPTDRVLLLAIVFPPAALGILVGATWPRISWQAYLSAALGMGALNLFTVWAVIATPDSEFNLGYAFFLFVVAQGALLYGGGLLGAGLNRLARRIPPPPGPGARFSPLVGLVLQTAAGVFAREMLQGLLNAVRGGGMM